MTTGSDIVDNRVPTDFPSGAGQLIGTYWSRVWTGGNNPSLSPPTNIFNAYADKIDRLSGLIPVAKPELIRRHWGRPPKRARNGEHDYTVTLRSFNNTAGTFHFPSHQNDASGSFENFWGKPTFVDKWTANDDLALLGKLREAVAGSSFNAAVFLAEGNESLHLIATAASRIDKAYTAARAGKWQKAQQALTGGSRSSKVHKTAASNWLELQYGVKPLLNDVYDAAQSLAHFTSVPVQQVITVTRKVKGIAISSSDPSIKFLNASGFRAKKIKAIVREVNIVSLTGLTDPASVAWEKLPYSFVVDWFVPIGSFLAARGLAQSVTGTFVQTDTIRYSVSDPYCTVSGASLLGAWNDYKFRSLDMKRTVSTTLSVPLPEVKPLSKSASWAHAANAVALLTNLLKR